MEILQQLRDGFLNDSDISFGPLYFVILRLETLPVCNDLLLVFKVIIYLSYIIYHFYINKIWPTYDTTSLSERLFFILLYIKHLPHLT